MHVKGVALQPSSRVAGAISLCFLWQPVTIINGQTNCLSLSSIDAVQLSKGVRIQRLVSVTYRPIDYTLRAAICAFRQVQEQVIYTVLL